LSELAEAAFTAFGKGGRVRFLTDKPDLSDLPAVSTPAPYQDIGFSPRVDIMEGFRRIRNFREGVS
jgi:hypothetical protein